MENKPLISVIMGIYNCADTLNDAVECIINQTYDNWELIMCDDCSTDNTYDVALELAENDKRIIVMRNEKNLTLAPTLNKCAKVAKGKYLARMDGDDVCSLDRFEKELFVLEKNPKYALVSCQMNLFDKDGIYRIITHFEEPTPRELVKCSQFCHAGCMIRKSVFDSVGGYNESSNYKRVEDYDLWTRIYKEGCIGFNIQEPLYSMRDDRNAIMRRTFENRINEVRIKRNIIKWFKIPFYCRIYVIIPLIKAIMPKFIYKIAHKVN